MLAGGKKTQREVEFKLKQELTHPKDEEGERDEKKEVGSKKRER